MKSKESPILDLLNDGYELLDYEFIVAETSVKSTRPAVIFTTCKEDREIGLRDLDNLIEDYKWHKETSLWDLPRHLYENKGKVKLKVF